MALLGVATYDYFPKRLVAKQCKSNFDLPENAYWETDCWWACKPGWNKDVINSFCVVDLSFKDEPKKEESITHQVASASKVITNYIDYKDLLSTTNDCHVVTDRLEEVGTVAIACADDNLQTTEIVCELKGDSTELESSFVSCDIIDESDEIKCSTRMAGPKKSSITFEAKACKLDTLNPE